MYIFNAYAVPQYLMQYEILHSKTKRLKENRSQLKNKTEQKNY
jgi:hypothetical protein